MHLRRTAVALMCAAALTACGSTVQTSGQAAVGDGLSTSTGGAVGGTTGAPGGAGTGGSTGTAGAAGTTGALPGGSTGGAGTATGGATSGLGSTGSTPSATYQLPGITDSTVNIGYITADTAAANAALSGFGANGLTVGDQDAQYRALSTYVNEHGGMGGRKVKMIPYSADLTAGQATNAQAACETWTVDNKIFAVAGGGGQIPEPNLLACLSRAHVVSPLATQAAGGAAEFARYAPYYWAVGGLQAERMGATYVDGLFDQGFWQPTPGAVQTPVKTGLLYYNNPFFKQALDKGVKPALARHGLQLETSIEIAYSTGPSSDGATVAAIQSAELQFASRGINRVLFLDTGAGLAFFFMQNAQTQNYHPRYGLESGSNPSFIAVQSFAPDQLPGALGVGWQPANDINNVADLPKSAARTLCLRIMAKAGQAASSVNDQANQFGACSVMFFLKELLDRMTSITPAGLVAAGRTMTDIPSAASYSLSEGYGPGRLWGARSYSPLRWVTDCTCFRYYGTQHPT